MANALDRVKAAEAKYTAMGSTAEKLKSTLKNFKGTADLCYAAMRELHREIKKDQKDQRWAFWWFVLMERPTPRRTVSTGRPAPATRSALRRPEDSGSG